MFRIPLHLPKTLLGLLLAGSLTGCMAGGDGPNVDGATQRITGSIPQAHYADDVVGVRVIAGGQQVSASTTDANGRFDIQVPVGQNYSFEIVTRAGSYPVLAGPLTGTTPMLFDVCDPGDDFDLGDIDPLDFEEIDGDDMPWTDTESDCEVPPWICEDGTEDCFDEPLPCQDPESDPAFCWDEPLPCDAPDANPEFCWDDGGSDGGGWDGGEVPGCEDPSTNPEDCEPPPPPLPCDDPAAEPDQCFDDVPPPPCEDPAGAPENCLGECEAGDPFCDGPQEPGDGPCEGGYDDPSCWPEPDICLVGPEGDWSECEDGVGGAPEFPFPDFGCEIDGDTGGDIDILPVPPAND